MARHFKLSSTPITGIVILSIFLLWSKVTAQTETAYEESSEEKKLKLFDKERLSVNHAISFGMTSHSNINSLMSQSLYTTMLKYKFSKPVTVNLNFGLPIHNTYDPLANINSSNIKSADYFKNIPLDASIVWRPRENFQMGIQIVRDPTYGPSLFRNNYYQKSFWENNDFMNTLRANENKEKKKE